MDLLKWGRDPWGEWVLTHISWSLFWGSLFAGILFFVAHASYMFLSAHRKRAAEETAALETKYKELPDKIEKHSLVARLFHWVMAVAIVVTGLLVVFTGMTMLVRVRTPLFTRNPYLFSDSTWGWTYVGHGLAGVGLVGLVIAHVYFAVRPEKWWITKGMIFGWITKRQYLQYHEPSRWAVPGAGAGASAAPPKPSDRVC